MHFIIYFDKTLPFLQIKISYNIIMITIEEQMRNDALKFIKLINKLLDNHHKNLKVKKRHYTKKNK